MGKVDRQPTKTPASHPTKTSVEFGSSVIHRTQCASRNDFTTNAERTIEITTIASTQITIPTYPSSKFDKRV